MHRRVHTMAFLCAALGASVASANETRPADAPLTPSSVIEASSPDDWRTPDPDLLLHLTTADGEVIFELNPAFAPAHVSNVQALVAERYFDGLSIVRSQDNYVAQWGDPNAGSEDAKPKGKAKASLDGEYFRKREGLDYTWIDSRDPYADNVGFYRGFTVGADDTRAWLTHCYGALGAGRGMEPDSGSGAELYVVTGHAPRHLDSNVTLLGSAIAGMEHLSSLPRGTGPLGFYETPEEMVQITSIRLGSELPPEKRSNLEIMRTNTETFRNYVRSRTYRKNEWFIDETGSIGVCNVGVPVRPAI